MKPDTDFGDRFMNPAPTLFHQVPIGGLFRWRGANWLKSDQTHACRENSPGTGPEHVPSHDSIEIIHNSAAKPVADKR